MEDNNNCNGLGKRIKEMILSLFCFFYTLFKGKSRKRKKKLKL